MFTIAFGTNGGGSIPFPGGGNFNGGGGGFNFVTPNGPFGGRSALRPDPATLKAIARVTGGQFYRARTAKAVQAAYTKLGSSLGRKPGNVEVTDWFLGGAALLLVLAGVLSALWAPGSRKRDAFHGRGMCAPQSARRQSRHAVVCRKRTVVEAPGQG